MPLQSDVKNKYQELKKKKQVRDNPKKKKKSRETTESRKVKRINALNM